MRHFSGNWPSPDPAHRVDYPLETLEIHDGVMVYGYARVVLQRVDRLIYAAVVVGGVYLVLFPAVPRPGDPAVQSSLTSPVFGTTCTSMMVSVRLPISRLSGLVSTPSTSTLSGPSVSPGCPPNILSTQSLGEASTFPESGDARVAPRSRPGLRQPRCLRKGRIARQVTPTSTSGSGAYLDVPWCKPGTPSSTGSLARSGLAASASASQAGFQLAAHREMPPPLKAEKPPSTGTTIPLTKAEAGLQSQIRVPPNSWVHRIVPPGCARLWSAPSDGLSSSVPVLLPYKKPGAMALTLRPGP